MIRYFTLFILLIFQNIYGQEIIDIDLEWKEQNGELKLLNESTDASGLPVLFYRFPISRGDSIIASLSIGTEKHISHFSPPKTLQSYFQVKTYSEIERGKTYGTVFLYPLRSMGTGGVQILQTGRLKIEITSKRARGSVRNNPFSNESILSQGTLLKIPISSSGIYTISFADLTQQWGNEALNVEQIQLFSGHNSSLPLMVGSEKIDDLIEVPIYVSETDDIYFWGEGRDVKEVNSGSGFPEVNHNIYSDTNYYFLRHGVEEGKRIGKSSDQIDNGKISISQGKDVFRYEEENYNILLDVVNLQGSGRIWYSNKYTGSNSIDFSELLRDIPIILEEPARFKSAFAGRLNNTGRITFDVGGRQFERTIFSVNTGDIYSLSSRHIEYEESLLLTSKSWSMDFQAGGSSGIGYLDFMELGFEKRLEFLNAPLYFASEEREVNFDVAGSASDPQVWNITDPHNCFSVPAVSSGNSVVIGPRDNFPGLNGFVLFEPGQARRIEQIIPVGNQNLHALDRVDYLVIYHHKFANSARRLANFRREQNGFEVETVEVRKIFNEFSSGKIDPGAIRNFIKMLYERGNENIRVLLMGDGSFDYKNTSSLIGYPNENYVPVFETYNSWDPVKAFPSDDFYALMDDREGGDLKGALDISIGRLPVRTEAEAEIIVQKIIDYESNPNRFGPWRNESLFVADDGNSNLFLGYTEDLTDEMEERENRFQINKAYIDAYEKEVGSNDVRAPRINEIINNNAFEGQLLINYQGHGGSSGWADEAILSKRDLEKWNNYLKYPVLVTATCTFAGYDDPREVTAGEYALTIPEKGAVALFTTTRVVYASSNDRLTNSVFNRLYENSNTTLEIGEWLRLSKNANRSDTLDINSRKFTLLGDPAMAIGIPRHQIQINRINGETVENNDSLSLGALQKVTVEGTVHASTGEWLQDFNGEVYPVLFDKKKTFRTLGQGTSNSPRNFSQWQNVLYKGRASAQNGEFTFEFIIPKDIDYSLGQGRFSFYGEASGSRDAWGVFEDVQIGGTADNAIANDNSGPKMDIFLEDRSFMEGDEVNSEPLLLIDIEDQSGINVSGNGIGHDLVYYLDKETTNETVLNSYFTYDLDSYTSGSVEYPIGELEPGKHTLTIKVWDSHNNLSEKTVEFFVNKSELEIRNVYNYPNPFFDRTEFQFENPLIGSDLDIVIDIYSVSGTLVHRLMEQRNSAGQMIRNIFWNGKDDWGQKLANGVYLYKTKVIENGISNGTALTSDFQKMVILN
ncbi:type IX secretion system sortase PorU [Membranihabitans maritimus]|uniref:type IX secretion system sortase PorU n=1 Tax=Membranihabitans maritimus TaxID=2904244 RepID=UPI001F0154FD|nr:type IX secretion system sortase PorU [Membranihabitans maritimus]